MTGILDTPQRQTSIDRIDPWIVSGGAGFFIDFPTPGSPPVQEEGVQLVCSVYIPKGSIGFLKALRVAPFRPTVFRPFPFNVQVGEQIQFCQWVGFNPAAADNDNPPRPVDYWTVPFGWESYFNSDDENAFPPSWNWSLRLIQGNTQELRLHGNNIPPVPNFDDVPPPPDQIASWFLLDNVPVPSTAYRQGIPGRALSSYFSEQRVQVIQGDELNLHVPIPENTTLCLFTKWRQKAVFPVVANSAGRYEYAGREPFYPIGPSWGSLIGFNQSADQMPAQQSAVYGWRS